MLNTMLINLRQRRIQDWTRLDPLWALPDCVADLARAVKESQAWVMTGGLVVDDPVRPADSAGESEVDELPSPQPAQPKVQRGDQDQHMLDKGPWEMTPAVREGWKIFVGVSPSPTFLSLFYADPICPG